MADVKTVYAESDMAVHSGINILQCSVATPLKCGGVLMVVLLQIYGWFVGERLINCRPVYAEIMSKNIFILFWFTVQGGQREWILRGTYPKRVFYSATRIVWFKKIIKNPPFTHAVTDWVTECLYYDIWQTADEITMHVNNINDSLCNKNTVCRRHLVPPHFTILICV